MVVVVMMVMVIVVITVGDGWCGGEVVGGMR